MTSRGASAIDPSHVVYNVRIDSLKNDIELTDTICYVADPAVSKPSSYAFSYFLQFSPNFFCFTTCSLGDFPPRLCLLYNPTYGHSVPDGLVSPVFVTVQPNKFGEYEQTPCCSTVLSTTSSSSVSSVARSEDLNERWGALSLS